MRVFRLFLLVLLFCTLGAASDTPPPTASAHGVPPQGTPTQQPTPPGNALSPTHTPNPTAQPQSWWPSFSRWFDHFLGIVLGRVNDPADFSEHCYGLARESGNVASDVFRGGYNLLRATGRVLFGTEEGRRDRQGPQCGNREAQARQRYHQNFNMMTIPAVPIGTNLILISMGFAPLTLGTSMALPVVVLIFRGLPDDSLLRRLASGYSGACMGALAAPVFSIRAILNGVFIPLYAPLNVISGSFFGFFFGIFESAPDAGELARAIFQQPHMPPPTSADLAYQGMRQTQSHIYQNHQNMVMNQWQQQRHFDTMAQQRQTETNHLNHQANMNAFNNWLNRRW